MSGGITESVRIGLTDFVPLITIGEIWMFCKKDIRVIILCVILGYLHNVFSLFGRLMQLGGPIRTIRLFGVPVPLISFECIEWHASDRLRRQFGLTQGVPHQERDLGEAHGEVLTGLKNQDWSGTHSFWVMH
ncbi:hypothetical protein Ahy_A03g015693 isoform A [Arachis hypogaea]|uniref:Aminotransferase-like plant mobile domain-containing protein n=1 Tax=Arachis hypogaea TaxID=3818 RepID=A0A445E1G6_ARAHY|nr:hypothetical protein Ahy_A03g015693 isoform A [Arachis hypogaea]